MLLPLLSLAHWQLATGNWHNTYRSTKDPEMGAITLIMEMEVEGIPRLVSPQISHHQ